MTISCSCAVCMYLDCNRVKVHQVKNPTGTITWYRYGCNNKDERGFIVGYVKNKNELKYCGCSSCKTKTVLKVGCVFESTNKLDIKHLYMYCGKVQTHEGVMRLLYDCEKEEFITVEDEWTKQRKIKVLKVGNKKKAEERRKKYQRGKTNV